MSRTGKNKKRKQPGRSPIPPPGFAMRDRRHEPDEREIIEDALEDELEDEAEAEAVLRDAEDSIRETYE